MKHILGIITIAVAIAALAIAIGNKWGLRSNAKHDLRQIAVTIKLIDRVDGLQTIVEDMGTLDEAQDGIEDLILHTLGLKLKPFKGKGGGEE